MVIYSGGNSCCNKALFMQGRLQGFQRTGAQLKKIPGFSPIFKKRKLDCKQNEQKFEILRKLGLLASEASFKTGAWHPLANFSGCPGTRGTRTAAAPGLYKIVRLIVIFIKLLKTLSPGTNKKQSYPMKSI